MYHISMKEFDLKIFLNKMISECKFRFDKFF